jgi:uncharacterized membrane protein YbhN (UPF0104 family)
MAEGRTKHIFLILRVTVVTVVLAIWVVSVEREVGWSKVARTLVSLDPLVFSATLGMFAVSQVVVGLRWWMLLRTQHIFISPWAALKLHFLGMFYNNFLPSSVGGDLVRAWYVTKHTERGFEAVLSVFVDRALGFLSMILLALGSWLLFIGASGLKLPARTQSDSGGFFAGRAPVWLGVLAAAVALPVAVCLHSRLRSAAGRLLSKAAEVAARGLRKGRDAFVMYSRNPLTVIGVVAVTMVSQSVLITVFWLLGRSIGIEASIKYYFVFFPASWVLGALPVSVGGAVVVEGWLVYLFVETAGVAPDQALVLALCQRFVWMIDSLPGAGIHLFGAHLPKRFYID